MTNYDILKEYEAHKTPVPSYEEWQELSKQRNQLIRDVKDLAYIQEENAQLKKDIRYGFAVDDVVMERMDKLNAENQQFKELLYKCREKLDWLNGGYDVWGGELTDFIEEIDNVIGEKK